MFEAANFFKEGGPVETTTVLLYCGAVVTSWRLVRDRRTAAAITAVLTLCIVREAGLRRPLLALAEQAPAWGPFVYWALAATFLTAAVAGTAWLAFLLLRQRTFDRMHVTLATLLAALILSQIADRFPKMAAGWGSSLTPQAAFVLQGVEEVLEMLLPVLVMVAMFQARKKHGASLSATGTSHARARAVGDPPRSTV